MGWLPRGRANQDPDAPGKECVLAKCLEFPPETPPPPSALCLVLHGGGRGRDGREKKGRRSSVPREEGILRERQGAKNEGTDGEVRAVWVL